MFNSSVTLRFFPFPTKSSKAYKVRTYKSIIEKGRLIYHPLCYSRIPDITLLEAKTYLIFKLQVNKKPSVSWKISIETVDFVRRLGSRRPVALLPLIHI